MRRGKPKKKAARSRKGYQKPTLTRIELDLKNLAAKMQGPMLPPAPD